MTTPTREQVNKLLEMIQRHFPSLPMSDTYTDWKKWSEFAQAAFLFGVSEARADLEAELESLRKDAVPAGWCFYHADFSLQAAGKSKVGTVRLIRDAVGREWWHSLPEEQQEETPLYIYGKGRTVMEAIAAAPKEK